MFALSKLYLPSILAAAIFAAGASGFHVAPVVFSISRRSTGIPRHMSSTTTASSSTVSNVTDPVNVIYSPDSSQPVTPNQIKALRKEAAKRQARNTLAQIRYVDYQSGGTESSDEEVQAFLQNVCQELEEHELVQIRGVSITSRRKVFDRAEQMAHDLSALLQREVTFVDYKGHAVNLYCPSSESPQIVLRSNFQEGQWEAKIKPERDHRGQIVKE